MGIEAYRIKVEPMHLVKRLEIINQLIKQGFIVVGQSFGDIYLEKEYKCGYAEIAIHNSELHRVALNNYKSDHNRGDYANNDPVDDKESIIIQIAKPNHESIIDSLIAELREFSVVIPVRITDLQTKENIELNQYDELKNHYKSIHMEFVQWYPKLSYPIRCKDVFKQINR